MCIYEYQGGDEEGLRRISGTELSSIIVSFSPYSGNDCSVVISFFFFLINFRYFSLQGWKKNLCTSSFIITYGYGPLIVIITGAHLPRRILYLRLFYFSLIFFWEYRIFFDIVKITLLRFLNLSRIPLRTMVLSYRSCSSSSRSKWNFNLDPNQPNPTQPHGSLSFSINRLSRYRKLALPRWQFYDDRGRFRPPHVFHPDSPVLYTQQQQKKKKKKKKKKK